ncbi:uncharacterized protein Dvir_GJ13474, isoform A [Drosophila virilis]|uniref:Uncharacterized protein, isoform A n=1 Tax=Drosophila virilis TaxID=7244 RepID=B4LCG3_DROVI|nr:uncharacterized protein Dvir_GJ13474, isoform A [Drosophila virilis]
MAKITVLFLLFALFVFCCAEEVQNQDNPLEPLAAQLKKIMTDVNAFLEQHVDKEKLKQFADSALKNGQQFVGDITADLKKPVEK